MEARPTSLPFQQLHLDPNRFQPRSQAFSKDSVKRLTEHFDERELDPLRVWLDGKAMAWYVLAGHSRYEAIRRLIERGDLPASYAVPVDPYEASEAEAIDFAHRENEKGAALLPHERAAYLRRLKEKGYGYPQLVERSKMLYGEQNFTILYLAYLNPEGVALRTLKQFAGLDTKEAADVLTMAYWVGYVMRLYPQLTLSHENEIFGHLHKVYGERAYSRRISDFRNYVREVIERRSFMGQFDASKPLNLCNMVTVSQQEAAIREQLRELEAEVKRAQRAHDIQLQKYVKRGATGETLQRVLRPYHEELICAQRDLIRATREAQKAAPIVRVSQTALFAD